jgi:hypothetical protein
MRKVVPAGYIASARDRGIEEMVFSSRGAGVPDQIQESSETEGLKGSPCQLRSFRRLIGMINGVAAAD